MKDYIITFFSHYDALAFCKYLKEKNIAASVMPTPRKLSASCGNCVAFSVDEKTYEGINFDRFEVNEIHVV